MIAGLGMGTNAKLLLGLQRRPPAYGDWSGDLLADDPALQTWDSSLAQRPEVREGLLTLFTGGAAALALPGTAAHAPAPPGLVRDALARLEQVAPGIRDALTGEAWLDAWASDRWAGRLLRGVPARGRSPTSGVCSSGPPGASCSRASTPPRARRGISRAPSSPASARPGRSRRSLRRGG